MNSFLAGISGVCAGFPGMIATIADTVLDINFKRYKKSVQAENDMCVYQVKKVYAHRYRRAYVTVKYIKWKMKKGRPGYLISGPFVINNTGLKFKYDYWNRRAIG